MKVIIRAVSLAACIALVLAVSSSAHAQITSATVYENIPDTGNAGDSANMASSLANASFNIGSLGIDFASPGDTSVAAFLNNPIFLNPVHGFDPNYNFSSTGIELVITGSTFLAAGANSFSVGHDDGVVLTMPGIGTGSFGNIVDAPGPTGFTTTPFTVNNPGLGGEFTFTLDYSECCGPPADLLFTVNGAPITTTVTPEPSSFIMLGSGLLAAAGMVRRRFVA